MNRLDIERCNAGQYMSGCPTPWLWFLIGAVAVVAVLWGWTNLKYERHLPASPIAFLSGCLLWAVALFKFLPWLADNT